MSGIPIRIGTVSDTFPDKGMVSVTFPQLDGATTGKLLLFSYTDEYKVPRVGDTVLVLMLTNSKGDGIVLGKLWSEKNAPPDPGDDIFKKELSHDYGKAFLKYDDKTDILTIHAGEIHIEGDGETIILKDGTVAVTCEHMTNSGDYSSPQDVVGGGISLDNHTHTGVHGETSPPH